MQNALTANTIDNNNQLGCQQIEVARTTKMTANKVAEFGAGAKYNAICLSCNRKFLTLASAGGIINYKPEVNGLERRL